MCVCSCGKDDHCKPSLRHAKRYFFVTLNNIYCGVCVCVVDQLGIPNRGNGVLRMPARLFEHIIRPVAASVSSAHKRAKVDDDHHDNSTARYLNINSKFVSCIGSELIAERTCPAARFHLTPPLADVHLSFLVQVFRVNFLKNNRKEAENKIKTCPTAR